MLCVFLLVSPLRSLNAWPGVSFTLLFTRAFVYHLSATVGVCFMYTHTKVAADARLLSLKTTTFGCEEGSLTGESVAVSKFVEPVAADSTIAVSIALGKR